ncbi:hypothetical protein INR49_023788 [Caranx melampygus]|nr:hypothetical protein INR49_023788 [Caranx melampygus]
MDTFNDESTEVSANGGDCSVSPPTLMLAAPQSRVFHMGLSLHTVGKVGVALVPFAGCQSSSPASLGLTFLWTAGEGAAFQREEDSGAGGEDAVEFGAAVLEVQCSVLEVRDGFWEVQNCQMQVHWRFVEVQYSEMRVYCEFSVVHYSEMRVYCEFSVVHYNEMRVYCEFSVVHYSEMRVYCEFSVVHYSKMGIHCEFSMVHCSHMQNDHERRAGDENELQSPKADVGDREEVIVADVFATRLAGIAVKVYLVVTPDTLGCHHEDQHPEDKDH